MVAGTFIYYNVVRVPCARLYDDEAAKGGGGTTEQERPLLGDRDDEAGVDAERVRRDSF